MKLTKKEQREVIEAANSIADGKMKYCCPALTVNSKLSYSDSLAPRFSEFYGNPNTFLPECQLSWLTGNQDSEENRTIRVLWLLLFLEANK